MHAIAENRTISHTGRSTWILLAGAFVFGALAYCSIELSRGDGRIAAVWLPNGLAVAFLLRHRIEREPLFFAALFVGNILANLAVGDALLQAIALSSCNSLEIFLAVLLVRRYCSPAPDMLKISHLAWFVLLAGVVAPVAAASLAMVAVLGSDGSAIEVWLKWATTDALGMILIAPSIMIITDAIRNPRRPNDREIAEWLLLTLGGTLTTYLVFSQTQYPLLFLVAPVVLIHAFRLGSLGTAISIIGIAAIATFMTAMGHGPINLVDQSQTEELLVLQAFLASAFVMGLPVAAVLNGERTAKAVLDEQQAQLRLLTDNITDAVIRYDADGICTYCSPSVQDVLGTDPETFIGNRASDRMHPEARKTISRAEARLLSGESSKERFTYRRYLDDENGDAVFIEADAAIALSSETGQPEGIVVSARDVTHRVTLEQLLKRARKHAENAAVAKSQFLANMSHEIRTPMNGVLGFVDLLLLSEMPPEQRRHAELIKESGDSMMALLNDILDISKIDAGQIVINHEPVDLRHLIKNCLRLHSANAEGKDIELTEDIAEAIPQAIDCDALRLRQIILNLLGNAVKFTERGEISVTAGTRGGQVVIDVRDSGIGIPEDRLDAIFKPFEQGDNAISRKYGGTGLGLSISLKLAGLLGGNLTATSEPGTGSCFTLSFPLVEAGETLRKREKDQHKAASCTLIPGSRILLAEDHDINRILVSAMLERSGQSVETAADGQQAVSAVMEAQSLGAPYDLVLMDVQMPEIDGFLATQTIRSLGIDADELPIIALTANAFDEDVRAAHAAGMQAHLAKPLQYERLVEVLQDWLPTATGDESPVSEQLAEEVQVDANAKQDGPSIEDRWLLRRKEALDAVTRALREGLLDGQDAEELARTVHKLAGTAGMFGEDELGRRASALERALKSQKHGDERLKRAEELLQAA